MINDKLFIISLSNASTKVLTKHKDALKRKDIITRIPDYNVYTLLSNKEEFMYLCTNYGFSIPKILSKPEIKNMKSIQHRFVIKPKKEISGSTELSRSWLIDSKNEYQKALDSGYLDDDRYRIEQYIDGPSYYYTAHYVSGRKTVCFSQRTVVQQPNGGSVVKATPCHIPEKIVSPLDKMFHDIEYDGVMMIELKKAENETYYAIECNPRLWGTLQLALDHNVNYLKHIINYSKDDSSHNDTSPKVNINCQITKKSTGYIWFGGYLLGCIKKLKGKQSFTRYPIKTKYAYRDPFARFDTIQYFILSPVLFLFNSFKGKLSKLFR